MSDLRAMIEAARADGPSTAARANVWTGVSTMVGEAAIAGGAGGAAATGSAGAAKMLVLGTLLGGTVTIGVGVAMLFVGRAPSPAPTVSVAAPAPAEAAELAALSMPALTPNRVVEARANPAPALARTVVETSVNAAPAHAFVIASPPATRLTGFETGKRPAPAHASTPSPIAAGSTLDRDSLAHEASSLAEARRALARRDALSALQIVRDLHALPDRQLIPEELAVEAQALRGLGLDDEASQVETHLRVRFPDSVLGR
jgi:hypothetical protein